MRLVRILLDGHAVYARDVGDVYMPLIGGDLMNMRPAGRPVKVGSVPILAPAAPSKVVAVGLNYRDHAEEMGESLPENPLLFIKPSTGVIGPGAEIVMPAMSARVDYEAELAIVIGRAAKNVPPGEAASHILGYTCLNDVTARDLQKKDGQWTRAKSFDTFCPMGPSLETEIDPSGLRIEARVNGLVRQSSSTANLIFSVPELLSFISRVMTLLPGDVIATGTPPGVGPLAAGDLVEVEIEGIGILANRAVRE